VALKAAPPPPPPPVSAQPARDAAPRVSAPAQHSAVDARRKHQLMKPRGSLLGTRG
jgi:hypothetical protein